MGYGTGTNDAGQAILGVSNSTPSSLVSLLLCDDIQPGSAPSYETCKILYTYHPLGAKMAEAPVELAQSQEREFEIPGAPEQDLIEAFKKEWKRTGIIGADSIIRNVMTMARVYGIASVVAVTPDVDASEPLPVDRLHELDLFYNVVDPLNTAGSLVLNQDPNSPLFLRPTGIQVAGKAYHASRAAVVMNEQPVYIEWSNSAFGYVGRSVYQRALYPLKSYVQSMITDNAVTEKAGLLVTKLKQPGSILDQRVLGFFGLKRQAIQGAQTGNVVSIGIDEDIQSIDLKNLKDAAEFARSNILKNIATAAKMPASMLNQETLAEGFGEGTEDAKTIARYIDGVRNEMQPVYTFFDEIVMRRAWSPEFYATLQTRFDELADKPYETAFYEWKNAFKATFPNLLIEPDSEKVKVDDMIVKGAVAVFEVMAPHLDPDNLANTLGWLADIMNERDLMFSSPLVLDTALIEAHASEVAETAKQMAMQPKPEGTLENVEESTQHLTREGA